jgi:DNA-directed RNA polymerase subunit RPC12/RpoP
MPAYVCIQCGERYFDESEVDAIQNMIKAFEEKLKKIQKAS